MEYGNGKATMIEFDMVYVSYFGDFLSKGSRESFEQNILFRHSPPRKACMPTMISGARSRVSITIGLMPESTSSKG